MSKDVDAYVAQCEAREKQAAEQQEAEIAHIMRHMPFDVLKKVQQAASVERAIRSNEIATGALAGSAQACGAGPMPALDQKTAKPSTGLPTAAADRKGIPIYSGVLRYFPDAIAAVAHLSKVGNDQHNPGQPLHWAREKSTDHHDCILRHVMEAGTFDTDGIRHSAKVAWRALAALQVELEQAKAAACFTLGDGALLGSR